MNMKRFASALFLVVTVLPLGCSSVRYDDPNKVENLTIDWGSTDLQSLAGGMIDSMIASPALSYLEQAHKGDDKKIIAFLGGIDNRTSEHIDTIAIMDKIKVALLKSGKFRMSASPQGQDEVAEQVRFQQGSGRVDPDTARAFGKQLGADVVVYGRLYSIDKHKGRSVESGGVKKDDVYYQFVLECANIDTAEVIWADEKELRKTERTGLFGR